MTDRKHNDDFEGLEPDEASQLESIADTLSADRFEPDEPHFWDSLHQRIMNEVAVTPAPQPREAVQEPALGSRLSALRRVLGGWMGLASAVGAAAVIVALAFVLKDTSQPYGEGPVELPSVGADFALAPSEDGTGAGIAVYDDDALWTDGFFENALPDEGEDDAEELTAWASWEDVDDDVLPFEAGYSEGWGAWGLGELDDDELAAFESWLEG